ncbi:MAG: inositol monophosphatase family protein [Myxococcaceae bacterium]
MAVEPLEVLLASAEAAARLGGAVLRDSFAGARTISFKGGIDLVTDADKASEAAVLGFLRTRHPLHSMLAEESGASGAGAYRWIVDPLDGTTNYAHHLPHFCVSVAVEGPEGLLAGVVYEPLKDELFAAARGRGATCNGVALHVSEAVELKRSLLCTGFPYNVHQHPDGPMGLLQRFVRKAQGIRRMGSAALELAWLAAGRFDGYFEFGLKPWDIAAGALLVLEAGGLCRRIDGAPLDLSVGDVVACAPGLEVPLVGECRTFLAELGYQPRTGGFGR